MDRTRVRTRGAKNVRTDADDPARVRDPAVELLLSHTATLTDEWCSRRRVGRHPIVSTPRSRRAEVSDHLIDDAVGVHLHPNLAPVRPGSSAGRPGMPISAFQRAQPRARAQVFSSQGTDRTNRCRLVPSNIVQAAVRSHAGSPTGCAPEVDDATQSVVDHQEVRSGDIAVDPDVRARPFRGHRRVPDRDGAVSVDRSGELSDRVACLFVPGRHGPAAVEAVGPGHRAVLALARAEEP